MSDTTAPSSPVTDARRSSNVEDAASLDAKSEEVVITWQLKALMAGRTPLPSSKPKRKLDEAKKPKLRDAKTARKQWGEEDINRVISMRRHNTSWEQILKHFPGRTIVGVRQIYWKYT
ncbi:hypothetical protein ACQKWADRAFT_316430 [Trichoderma austrokoningii]